MKVQDIFEVASTGSKVEYTSYELWKKDLPKKSTFHKGDTNLGDDHLERAQSLSKQLEGVSGTWDNQKKKGWIYAHYLDKKNLREAVIEESVGLNPKQAEQFEKLMKFGWKLHGQYAIHDTEDGVAAVLVAKGNNAVLYPDGSMDRSTAQKTGKVQWRKGWYDARRDALKAAQQEKFERWLKHLEMIVKRMGGDI